MNEMVIAKLKLLRQFGIVPTPAQKEHLYASENEFQLERRVRDIINPPMKREVGASVY